MGSTQMLGSKNVLTCCVEKKGVGTKVWSILFVGVDNIFLNVGSNINGSNTICQMTEQRCSRRSVQHDYQSSPGVISNIFSRRSLKFDYQSTPGTISKIFSIRSVKFDYQSSPGVISKIFSRRSVCFFTLERDVAAST